MPGTDAGDTGSDHSSPPPESGPPPDVTTDQGSEVPPPDSGPAGEVLVSGEPPIVDLAVDDSHVYYVTQPAKLRRVPKSGGPAETINDGALDSGLASARLAMGPLDLYWANATEGAVVRIDKASYSMKYLAAAQGNVLGLAATGTHVVWGNDAGLQVLATGPGPAPFTADATSIGPGAIATSASSVYFASASGLIVRRDWATLGQNVASSIIATAQTEVAELRTDAKGAVYWIVRGDANGCGSTIRRASPGAPPESWIEPPCPKPGCGAARAFLPAGAVAYIGRENCGLQRVDSVTGVTTELGPQSSAARIATDGTSVFWATSTGAVLRIAKGDSP